MAPFLLSPEVTRDLALALLAGVNYVGKTPQWKEEELRAHYGTSSVVLAHQWFDLCTSSNQEIRLSTRDNSEQGFKRFMMAHFFLWQYPKNARTFGSRFRVCERLARGELVFGWVRKIASLSSKVIIWKDSLDATTTHVLALTVDGVDCRTWEKKHERYNMDTEDCSFKHNHGAVKYEIGISVYEPQCVWLSGPHKGGKHDLTIFREGLKKKVKPWKMVIADRGYESKEADEQKILSTPSVTDGPILNEYKRRARLRHESFNGRLKKYSILSETYRHDRDYHRSIMEAVVVTVQYEMNNGAPIFDVSMQRE